jgi:hypothetical protein
MPRYYFDIKNGHRLIDNSGLDCRDEAQALVHADFIARQIATDSPKSVGRQLLVLDDERCEVAKVQVKSQT